MQQRSYFSASFIHCTWFSIVGETAENLKKSGAFVPGIRPGDNTAKYIDKILFRLTFVGAIYITLVCLLPEFPDSEVQRAISILVVHLC
jgi:preprotein translocase subunit SecY